MLLLGAITMHAATGTSCYDAIPLGKDYTETINGPKTVWYVAKTFDLPVKVCFTPINIDLPSPDVEMDFTCIPGVYEDSILCSLFCKNNSNKSLYQLCNYKNYSDQCFFHYFSLSSKAIYLLAAL